jgi:AP-3 complex subunit beta
VTENNVSKLLREFNFYVKHEDKKFVTNTVQAIGECALKVPEVMETCLHGLMGLVSNKSELVVAESVVVLKKTSSNV